MKSFASNRWVHSHDTRLRAHVPHHWMQSPRQRHLFSVSVPCDLLWPHPDCGYLDSASNVSRCLFLMGLTCGSAPQHLAQSLVLPACSQDHLWKKYVWSCAPLQFEPKAALGSTLNLNHFFLRLRDHQWRSRDVSSGNKQISTCLHFGTLRPHPQAAPW